MSELHPIPAPRWAQVTPAETPSLRSLTTLAAPVVVARLEFLDVVLGDRPALTPVENFYQRVLSGDPDETLEQAELLLKERSLSSYYDEIAIKGLRLAAIDVVRQVVTPLQLDRIRDALNDLVEGLDEHPDADPAASETEKDIVVASGAEQGLPRQPTPDLPLPIEDARPPEWRSPEPVLCIGGRGPFDGVVVEMLAQLLQKHAIGARQLSREAASRAHIASLDTRGIAMVFIGYLERTGSPAELRYVVRRIRSRLPGATIVVGLWPDGDPILEDHDRQKAMGADHYVTSLRDAITVCLKTAQQASVDELRPEQESHLSVL
jgi:hypothetical protein